MSNAFNKDFTTYTLPNIFPGDTCSFIESISNLNPNTLYNFNANDLVLLNFQSDNSGIYKFSQTTSGGKQLPGFPISNIKWDVLSIDKDNGDTFKNYKVPKINLVQDTVFTECPVLNKKGNDTNVCHQLSTNTGGNKQTSYCMTYKKPSVCHRLVCPYTFNSMSNYKNVQTKVNFEIRDGAIGIHTNINIPGELGGYCIKSSSKKPCKTGICTNDICTATNSVLSHNYLSLNDSEVGVV